jgi:uncharacterized protein YhfF
MIFSETADLVMNGTKTQTRRLAKPHDSIMLFKISTNNYGKGIYNDQMNRMRYHILVTDIRLEPLQDISIHDAIAEGILPEGIKDPEYPTTYLMGFIKTWMRLYPTGSEFSWENNPKVVVLEFERVME